VVRHPAQARLAVAAVAVGLLLAGCGGGGSAARATAASALSGAPVPVELGEVNCLDWRNASEGVRRDILRRMHAVAVSNSGGADGRGPALTEKGGYNLFQTYCANEFARGFKLYKLYGRAAGLAGG